MTGHIDLKAVERLPMAAIPARKISEETATKFGVRTEFSQENGEPLVQWSPLFNGEERGWHKRTFPKDCRSIGKDMLPFGSHIAGNQGKFLIVTEGVEDCLAAHEMLQSLGKNYRVVATLGTTTWKKNIAYFNGFEKVVIAYDMDAPGREAAIEFATALGHRARVAKWTDKWKDPCDLHLAGRADTFLNAIFKAEAPAPDGILSVEEVWERIENYTKPISYSYPPEFETAGMYAEGMREGEISLWIAGTGSGKTSYIRRMKQHLITNTEAVVGEIELEEAPEKTIRGMLQFQGKKMLSDMTPEEKREAFMATYGTGRLHLLDHRARYTRGMSLMDKIKQLHYSMGCNVIFLDHITLAVSEFGDGGGLAEQDRMMNEFLEFVETTKCHLVLISHLRKAQGGGKSFEEGAVPREDDIKGSGSIKQISFDIFALSRNKHHPDEYQRNVSQLHVLKCRETGDTGPADKLYWDKQSQSFVKAVDPVQEGQDEEDFGDDPTF